MEKKTAYDGPSGSGLLDHVGPLSTTITTTPELLTSFTRKVTGLGPAAHTRSSKNAEILALAVSSGGGKSRHLFLHLKDDGDRTTTPSFMHSHEGRSGCLTLSSDNRGGGFLNVSGTPRIINC